MPRTYGPKFPYKLHGITKGATGIIGEAPNQQTAIENAIRWLKNNPKVGLEVIIMKSGAIVASIYSETASRI